MSRVVAIVDSETGLLIDANGVERETGRYLKFAGRMLSRHKNPILDYGVNGGDTLTVCKGGAAGSAINLEAGTVNVSGALKVSGKTIPQIVDESVGDVLGRIRGKEGEILVGIEIDDVSGMRVAVISLNPDVAGRIMQANERLDEMSVRKRDMDDILLPDVWYVGDMPGVVLKRLDGDGGASWATDDGEMTLEWNGSEWSLSTSSSDDPAVVSGSEDADYIDFSGVVLFRGSRLALDSEVARKADKSDTYTKGEVNALVQSNAAHYRGYYATWSDVPSDASLYPEDDDGNRVPGPNDYIAVGNMSDYPSEGDSSDSSSPGGDEYSGAWRMTYSGSWDDHGKNGWQPSFQYNESPLSPPQQAALDSGITSQKVGKLDALPTAAELTPVAPSTDASAQGKPADAKATGDALAGKLSTSGGQMTGEINFVTEGIDKGYLSGNGFMDPNSSKYVHWPDEILQDDTFAMVSQIPDISGKADAADLRYRIAEAELTAKLPTGVTVWYESEEVTDYAIVTDAGMNRWELNVADSSVCIWDLDGTNGDPYGAEFKDGGGAALSTTPNLIIFRALADRTVNLITATDETSIDIKLPAAVTVDGVRYCRDLILDVDNSANASDLALEFTSLGVDYAFVPLEDDSISEMMTIGAGERVRLYFTETPYRANGSLPVINVARVTLGDFVTSTTPATQGGN